MLSLIAVRTAQRLELRRYGEAVSDASPNLVAGLAAGIALGAVFGWRRSRALGNDWQRGVIAVLGAVGALLIAFFFAIPLHHFFGMPGLVALAAITTGLGVAGSRWAVRGAGDAGVETG